MSKMDIIMQIAQDAYNISTENKRNYKFLINELNKDNLEIKSYIEFLNKKIDTQNKKISILEEKIVELEK